MVRVLIVDDDIFIRESLKMIMEVQGELEVVGTCEQGKVCIEKLEEESVDVILLDLRMPVMSGIEVLSYLRKHKSKYEAVKVLVLTTFDEEDLIQEAIQNGAAGYLLKNSTPDKIITAIKSVALGSSVFETQMVQNIGVKSTKVTDLSRYNLSAREMDVIKLIADGLSNKEISSNLYISEGTVKNYITSILTKMDLKHRTQIAIAYLKGINE